MRGEVTLAGEAMAAFKFAKCKRVLCFGWDESTKFGNAVFSCSFQVEHFDGTREDLCLRGLSIMPEGGTSKAVLKHIETRILAYSRAILAKWVEVHEKQHGLGSWAAAGGPSPENIGLHRLCEDTVLMTDTCNGARCTKRLLTESIVQAIAEKLVDALLLRELLLSRAPLDQPLDGRVDPLTHLFVLLRLHLLGLCLGLRLLLLPSLAHCRLLRDEPRLELALGVALASGTQPGCLEVSLLLLSLLLQLRDLLRHGGARRGVTLALQAQQLAVLLHDVGYLDGSVLVARPGVALGVLRALETAVRVCAGLPAQFGAAQPIAAPVASPPLHRSTDAVELEVVPGCGCVMATRSGS